MRQNAAGMAGCSAYHRHCSHKRAGAQKCSCRTLKFQLPTWAAMILPDGSFASTPTGLCARLGQPECQPLGPGPVQGTPSAKTLLRNHHSPPSVSSPHVQRCNLGNGMCQIASEVASDISPATRPLASAKRCSSAVGSAPGERINIMGARGDVAGNTSLSVHGGGIMYSAPRMSSTYAPHTAGSAPSHKACSSPTHKKLTGALTSVQHEHKLQQ